MNFVLESKDKAVKAVVNRLRAELSDSKNVLWLISGGSQIAANVEIMKAIPVELSQKLRVLPVDERYGEPGHADSNWAQLINSGFDGKQAKLFPVLIAGMDFDSTAERYEQLVSSAFGDSDVVVGQLGLGEDGHTAGILPKSPASEQRTDRLVVNYQAGSFKRMTLTFKGLRRINVAYVLAYGEAKRKALENLKQDLELMQEPAQIFKDIAEAYIYNDQLGGENA